MDPTMTMKKTALKKKLRTARKNPLPQKGSLIKKEIVRQVQKQRKPFHKILAKDTRKAQKAKEFVKTGIPGFDELMEKGLPKGISTLVCGGPGSGKTIFCLQTMNYGASKGEKCLYMTFEESPERLKEHMKDFGWDPDKLIKQGNLIIKKYSPFEVTRQVEAMLEEAKGELLIDIKPILFPSGFKPDRIAVDSLSAIASAFVGKEETYRIYIEQLFRIFEQIGANAFLISESTDVATKLTASGVEEFLADGVFVFYNIKRGNIRELATEILKIRGAKFQKKIVAIEIKSGEGIIVYPEQEVFGEVAEGR